MVNPDFVQKLSDAEEAIEAWLQDQDPARPLPLDGLPALLAEARQRLKAAEADRAQLVSDLEQIEGQRLNHRRRVDDALSETQQLYRSLFLNNHAVMLLIDPATGDIKDANPAACRFYGYPHVELTRKKITSINVLAPVQVFQELEQAHDQQRDHFFFEHRLANGEIRQVEVYSGPIRVAGKSLLYSIVHDITEQKQTQDAIRAYAIRLEQINSELRKFAFVASHDLQEPLRKIQIFGDRLRSRNEANLDGESQRDLERMQASAARMGAMIHGLMVYSQLSARPRRFRPVDLNLIAKQALEALASHIESVEGQVRVDELPVLDGEPHLLRDLFRRLIENGLKFHRPGVPPRIQVSCRTLSTSGNLPERIEIRFSDNGLGIAGPEIEQVFQPFQHHPLDGKEHGLGLGLAISSKIVERHQGIISVHSRPGEGTVVQVVLPLEQGQALEKTLLYS